MNLHVTRATDANNGKQNRTQPRPTQPNPSQFNPTQNGGGRHPHKAKPLQRLRVKLTF